MEIHGIIVHKIEKDQRLQGQPIPEAIISPRTEELDRESPLVIELTEYIWKAYRKGKTFGSFNEDAHNHPVQTWIGEYLHDPDSHPFVGLTLTIMGRLKIMLEDQNFSTGGHVLFLHVTENEKPWFMVVMIKDKKGFIFTDDLDLKDVVELNLDKLHQAVRVDIGSWQQVDEKAYLSFIKSGAGDVPRYFLKTFGCTDSIPSKIATNAVLLAAEQVCVAAGKDRTQTRVIKGAICDYMEQHLTGVSLAEIEAQLDVHVDQEYWDMFTELANSDEYKISDNFEPNRQVIEANRRVKLSAPHWKLTVDKGALGRPGSDAEIIFDPDDNSLTIKQIPQPQVAGLSNIVNLEDE